MKAILNFTPKPIITKAIQEKAEPPSKPTFVAASLLMERRRFFLAPLPTPPLLLKSYYVFSDQQKGKPKARILGY